jgi:hypothetical protein
MHLLPFAAALMLLAPSAADAYRNTQTVEQALAGRTAGKPTACIQQSQIYDSQIYDSGAILYRMKGGPDYLNTLNHRCPFLRQDRAIASRTPTGSLCSGDILTVFDPVAHFDYGGCGLGEFVPYEKAK